MEVTASFLDVRLGTQRRCDGSASVKLDKSEAVAGVFGPMEARTSTLQVDGVLEVSFKRLGDMNNQQDEAQLSLLIRDSLQSCIKFIPRTVISLSVRVLAEEGGGMTAAFLSSVASLINAGIPLLQIPVAVEGILNDDEEIEFEPSLDKLPEATARFLFVFGDDESGPTSVVLNGRCSKESLFKTIERSKERAREYRQALRHHFKTYIEKNGDFTLAA